MLLTLSLHFGRKRAFAQIYLFTAPINNTNEYEHKDCYPIIQYVLSKINHVKLSKPSALRSRDYLES